MNTPGTPSQTKADLRRSMRVALRGVSPEQAAEWSSGVRLNLMQDPFWLPPQGGVVAMFGGLPAEPDLLPLLPWLAERGVRTALFLITGDSMEARLVQRPEDLRTGVLGVLEPDPAACELVPMKDIGTVLLPGLAFSQRDGMRLGRGKGYYDRAMAALPPTSLRIGVCFHLQLHDPVPHEPHDAPVQHLITEQGWLSVGG